MNPDRAKKIFLVLILVSIFCMVSALSSGLKKQKEATLRKDTQIRLEEMQAELDKTKQLNDALQKNLKEKVAQLEEMTRTNESLQGTLAQEQLKNKSLTLELERLTNLNKQLEEKQKTSATKAIKK